MDNSGNRNFPLVTNLFGLSQPTTSMIIWRFVKSFVYRGRHFLHWPRGQEMESVKHSFKDRWGFANCCGAIDGTHIIITRPINENGGDYFDRMKNLSVSVQGISDYSGKFLDFSAGWPGTFHDTRMLLNTKFYHAAHWNREKLVGPHAALGNGTAVREYILGDARYPCTPWLVVPFPCNQGPKKELFNSQLSSARMCVERSFGRLKGTWRILLKKMNRSAPNRICKTIYCCALMHNMILAGPDIPVADWRGTGAHPEGYLAFMERNQAILDHDNPTRSFLFAEFMRTQNEL